MCEVALGLELSEIIRMSWEGSTRKLPLVKSSTVFGNSQTHATTRPCPMIIDSIPHEKKKLYWDSLHPASPTDELSSVRKLNPKYSQLDLKSQILWNWIHEFELFIYDFDSIFLIHRQHRQHVPSSCLAHGVAKRLRNDSTAQQRRDATCEEYSVGELSHQALVSIALKLFIGIFNLFSVCLTLVIGRRKTRHQQEPTQLW